MKRYSAILQADTPFPVDVGGNYFLLDSAPGGPVKVEFFGAGNVSRVEELAAAQAADWAAPENGFASIKLTSPGVGQTVTYYVAKGRTGTNRFSGTITGPLGADNSDAIAPAGAASAVSVQSKMHGWDSVGGQWARLYLAVIGGLRAALVQAFGTLGALGQVLIGGANLLQMVRYGFTYGASLMSTTTVNNSALTILSPAGNPNGTWLWEASFISHTAGTASSAILAKSSAPVSVTDGDALVAENSFVLDVGGTSQTCSGERREPIFVPAGKGIYRFSPSLETVAQTKALYTTI